ncbi:MAG TPA: bifunctional 5,10-methylenetetrahydrofolate dehydrogenase/5,10-methenyltetrahydrofolate cyclohydrolase [Candidatus Paceibacterota bacterium]|nr:bifunctional 5,10-methylenetetrahydrofolate dehydrogenase/5,10-methenyltetrahydrofolate cyclohydrolase [Candidatus Paceibacterota bacterium]
MIVDGKAIAADILRSVKERLQGKTLTVRAIVMAPTAVTESYLRIKEKRASEAGMQLEVVRMEHDAQTEDIIAKIALPGADAVIVQLPLPDHIDTKRVLDSIPLTKDADLLSDAARERFVDEGIIPPVAEAVREILERYEIDVPNAKAIVIGDGWLVGKPVADLLHRMGAQVVVLTKDSPYFADFDEADIIVSGAGQPHMVKPDILGPWPVLIDAGTSELGGAIAGDMDPACAENARLFTPVPGGVGPVAVACLFRNVAELAGK